MNDQLPISIGEILIMRAEFEHTSQNSKMAAGVIKRATILIQLLDELIECREAEGVRE